MQRSIPLSQKRSTVRRIIEPNGQKMTITKFVDGFAIPLQKDKVDLYRILAEKACTIWKEHSALEFRECVGDDLEAR
jgi:hypothetical protein